WIDNKNGNHYFTGAQYPESQIVSLNTLASVPITGDGTKMPAQLSNLATFRRTTAAAEVNHLNISRVTDVYVDAAGRDIGSVAGDIEKGLDGLRGQMDKE